DPHRFSRTPSLGRSGQKRRRDSPPGFHSTSRFGPYRLLPFSEPQYIHRKDVAPFHFDEYNACIRKIERGAHWPVLSSCRRRKLKRGRGCILLAFRLAQDGVGIAALPVTRMRSPLRRNSRTAAISV